MSGTGGVPAGGSGTVARPSRWRREPFRLFFPLGALIGWAGVGHWILYATGAAATYSCFRHGLIQVQAFLMSFAAGFLFTALPRRTSSAPVSRGELGATVAALIAEAAALLAGSWVAAEVASLLLFALLAHFALRRLLPGRAGRRPPASFVLLPIAVATGIAGPGLLLAGGALGAPPWTLGLGRLAVQQGVFLCLVLAALPIVWPVAVGLPPAPDLDGSPRELARASAYASAGCAVLASLVLESLGWERLGLLLRAAVVALGLGLGAGAWRRPREPGLYRRFIWLSVWLMPAGLAGAGLWPDYRVPALHVLFIGGFSLLAFSVATHVALGHLDLQVEARGRPPALVALAAGILLALAARVTADWSQAYFTHLGWAAAAWIAGTAVWLAWLGPRLLRGARDEPVATPGPAP